MALYSDFAGREALARYQEHPEYVAVADFIGKIRCKRTVVDYDA